jgi:GNAT superfamily N-acetyltransferase
MRTAISATYSDFHELAYHFLTLTATDRLLLFGRLISDLEIVAYVEALYLKGDPVFVVMGPWPSIAGAVHLETTDRGATLGLSVSDWARRQGIGTLLLERACLFASSRGINTFYVRNLSANMALRSLAHRVGMKVAWAPNAESTQVDLPVGNREFSHGKYVAGRFMLADYSMHPQGRTRPSVDSVTADILESTAA